MSGVKVWKIAYKAMLGAACYPVVLSLFFWAKFITSKSSNSITFLILPKRNRKTMLTFYPRSSREALQSIRFFRNCKG